jgi:hypothetical protein
VSVLLDQPYDLPQAVRKIFVCKIAFLVGVGFENMQIYIFLNVDTVALISSISKLIVIKSIIFWDVTPCSLLRCNRRFGGHISPLSSGSKKKFQQEPASKQVANNKL